MTTAIFNIILGSGYILFSKNLRNFKFNMHYRQARTGWDAEMLRHPLLLNIFPEYICSTWYLFNTVTYKIIKKLYIAPHASFYQSTPRL